MISTVSTNIKIKVCYIGATLRADEFKFIYAGVEIGLLLVFSQYDTLTPVHLAVNITSTY